MPEENKPIPFTPFDRDAWERSKSEIVRDEKGKFLPGTPSPNPAGRPRREVEKEAFTTFLAVVTPNEWEAAVAAVLKKAQQGDVTAFKVLADYRMGKPVEQIAVVDDRKDEVIELRFKAEQKNTIDIQPVADSDDSDPAAEKAE